MEILILADGHPFSILYHVTIYDYALFNCIKCFLEASLSYSGYVTAKKPFSTISIQILACNFNRFLIPFFGIVGHNAIRILFWPFPADIFHCSSQLAPSLKIIDCALFEDLKLHFLREIFLRRFHINFLL